MEDTMRFGETDPANEPVMHEAAVPGRRAALAAMLGGMAAAGMAAASAPAQAQAQMTSSPDTAPLQFALNLHYVTTNYLQVAIYGAGRQLIPDWIRGGEDPNSPGVPMTDGRQVPFTVETRTIQARMNEIADEHWWRTEMLRGILRADSPAQKRVDLSATPFTTMFRLAGAIGPDDSFDPYASPLNFVLASDTLLTVQASVLAGMLPTLTNDIVKATVTSLSTTAVANATTVRYILQQLAATRPGILTMVDRLVAWRDRIDGTSVTERPLTGGTTSAIGQTNADGLFITRTPQQALNVLFMSSGAVTQGGFLPTGINGTIATAAAN